MFPHSCLFLSHFLTPRVLAHFVPQLEVMERRVEALEEGLSDPVELPLEEGDPPSETPLAVEGNALVEEALSIED